MRTQNVECILYKRLGRKIRFLLLKRIPAKGGFWQAPTGGVEKEDDSLLDACYREIFEETGISKEEIISVKERVHTFLIHADYLSAKPIRPLEEFVFAFEVKPQAKVHFGKNISVEHSLYKWVTPKQALHMLKWNDNKDAFRKLFSLLDIS